MRYLFYRSIPFLLLGMVAAACGQSEPPFTPASNVPTFLYIYTEN